MPVEATSDEWEALQEIEPRVCTLDIEVDDRGAGFPEHGEERVLSIVAHDSYDDETVGFIDLNGREVSNAFPDGRPDNLDELHVQDSERKMFVDFRVWFQEKDPDLISGWNSDDFDIPFIIKRMENISGLNPDVLSRMDWSGLSNRGDPRIKGRTCYDLLTVYKKNSFTELDSYKLDDVAAEELGAEKIQFDGSYYDLYQNDPTKFVKYNAHDVVLTAGINDEAGAIEFRDILRREVGVDFEDSYDNKDFVDMMCRRKLRKRGKAGPTRPPYGEEPDSDFDGAFVFDPYNGVATNVVGIDLASLYPYTMAMLNASPETKVDPDDFDGEYCVASNGQAFSLETDGLFKSLVDDAIGLKADYKEKLKNADTQEEIEKWEKKYASAKTITNSIYGVTGWERFFLYDKDVAEAVTLSGQTVIKRTAEYVEEQGFDVIYGDTDSTYIRFPEDWSREQCLDKSHELCDELNDVVYPELAGTLGVPPADNLWDIEVEAYMERFFQAGKKKRYAYLATWKDGHEVPEPKISISGFSSKRSDSAALTDETERKIFDAIFDGEEDTVGTIVYEAAQEIVAKSPDWERVGIPSGMGNKIDKERAGQDGYYAFHDDGYPQGAHPRGVWNSNKILNLGLDSADKPKRVYIEPHGFEALGRKANVLCFETNADLEPIEEKIRLDVQRMTETILIRPLEEICAAIGVDVSAAVWGQEQTGLGAFTNE